jgi:hypothetical protein
MLREAATLTALNKVELDGSISTVGPCWFFPAATSVVFDLDDQTGGMLDEVYHGTWFTEHRRIESIKAHVALGGRLVHGCQSVPNQSGGACVSYGSWHHDANRLIGTTLGLPQLPVVPLGRPDITTSHPHGYLWKRDPVTAWIGCGATAWIDDDFTDADHAWADERTAAGIPTLLVQPDPSIGILPEHLTHVRRWAEGLHTQADPAGDHRDPTSGIVPGSPSRAPYAANRT